MQLDDSELLMLALADQLKTPLLQIAHLSQSKDSSMKDVSTISQYAIRLVDAYVVANSQTELHLEPMTTASVLYEVAQSIDPIAKQFNYQVQIDLRGNNKPIMGHRQTLKDMLFLLSTSLMQAGLEEETVEARLVLGNHRSSQGTVVGAFCETTELTQNALNLTRMLRGKAVQSAPALGAAGGTALAVADRLSSRMSAPLKIYRHNAMTGIGSLLTQSSQLQLI